MQENANIKLIPPLFLGYNETMELSLNIADIERLIKKQEKEYGKALGKLIGGGIGDVKAIANLAEINAKYKTLLELREIHLTPRPPAPEPAVNEVTVIVDPDEESDHDGPPPGICSSEDCEDEFCVEYWERIENEE